MSCIAAADRSGRRPRLRPARPALCGLAVLVACLQAAPPSQANTCSGQTISAVGVPSSLLFLAKSRAKAAWRAKVTATPGLGPDWIAWGIAQGRNFDCQPLQPGGGLFARKACAATATPCKFD